MSLGKDKKIGILSLNMYTPDMNYATRVHSLAFQKFLEKQGYDATIIDYVPIHVKKDFDLRHPADYYREHPEYDPDGRNVKKWTRLYKEREVRADKTAAFVEKNFRKTDRTYNVEDLDNSDPGFDIYIVATDVVWKWRDGLGFDKAFYLQSNCMKDKGKIAYSVSYNSNRISEERRNEMRELVQGIDYISCREYNLYRIIRDDFKMNPHLVLDPVFLHERSFYDELMVRPEREKPYVLVYSVINNSRTVVEKAVRYAEKYGYDVIELSSFTENRNYPEGTEHEVIYDAGVDEWLGYIAGAECIFTNSFHGCCFAILFNRPFYSGERGGLKLQWLLNILELNDRWFEPEDSVDSLSVSVDYDRVNELVKYYRKISSEFIISAIENVSAKLDSKMSIDPKGLEGCLIDKIYPEGEASLVAKKRYTVRYNSGKTGMENVSKYINDNLLSGSIIETSKGSYEYAEEVELDQNGEYSLKNGLFYRDDAGFAGWMVRRRNKKTKDWEWLCRGNVWKTADEFKKSNLPRFIFEGNETVNEELLELYPVFCAAWIE